MSRARSWRWAPSLVSAALLVALVAWGGTGIPASTLRLERIQAVLELHPERFWRVRPGLDVDFEGARVRTDARGLRQGPEPAALPTHGARPERPLRVLSLGASPTFGWGVEAEQAYPAVAEALLRSRGHDLEVTNAGQIGYAAGQGLALLEELLAVEQPGLITASWVVNDIDRLRFFLPNGRDDASTAPPSPGEAARMNRALHTWPWAPLRRWRSGVQAKLALRRSARPLYELAHPRTRPEGYRAALTRLVSIGEQRGIPVVLVLLPFHLPEEVPAAPAAAAPLLEQGVEELMACRVEEAGAAFEQAVELDGLGSAPWYWRGRVHEALGETGLAREAYARAYGSLIHDCVRDAARYNDIMATLAAELGVPLVDTRPALGQRSARMDRHLPGDTIHPNVEGHAAVGRCLASALDAVSRGEGAGLVLACD